MKSKRPLDSQLKALDRYGIKYEVLDESETRALLARFAAEFVDPRRRAAFEAEIVRPSAKQGSIAYESFLRPDRTIEVVDTRTILRWLTLDGAHDHCHRFDLRAFVPALRLEVNELDPAWATSWPGVFVDFDAGRALVVTLDMERVACDLGVAGRRDKRR